MLKDFLNEALNAKPQAEYERNYSAIPVDIYERIAKMDPKTTIIDGNVNQVGFMAKQLLIPKYIAGDTAFVDENKDEEIKQALINYKPGKHPNLASFGSIDQFLLFMEDPEENAEDVAQDNKNTPKESKIDAIYKQYYSEIPRETFDLIISADPNTGNDKIGDFARNLFLPKYQAGETNFATKSGIEKLKEIMQKFETEKALYSKEDRDPHHYKSVAEFIEYIKKGPESDFIRQLRNDNRVDQKTHNTVWQDIEFVGSDVNYNVFIPRSQMANLAIGGGYSGRTGGMQWCTTAEPEANGRQNFFQWDHYQDGGTKKYVMFMKKGQERGDENKRYNWQGNIDIRTAEFQHFLDGHDHSNGTAAHGFKVFLIQNPTLIPVIQDHPLFRNNAQIAAVKLLLSSGGITEINNEADLVATMTLEPDEKILIKKVVIKNVKEIMDGAFGDCVSLEEASFDSNLKIIGDQAFKNCSALTHIEFPESLEEIGVEAFANCIKLKGSVRLPDSLKVIKSRAFMGDSDVRLKLNKNRTNPLRMSKVDANWAASHIKPIDVKER